eukprot:gene50484-67604_t
MLLQTVRPNIVQAIRAYRVDDLMRAAQDSGQHFLFANLSEAQSKQDVLEGIAASFLFPQHFGKNLDALYDCMTDLVNKYKAKYKIEDNMLVKVNGEVMAIAFMQNAQNLFYRKDLFDKHGIKVPATYADMMAAAKTLKDKEPGIEFPIAQTFAKGWDSATEFTNIFAGYGGRFFKAGSAAPDFNSDAGVKALETMKAMT